MKNENQIKCPNCGTSIDVQDILSHQLEEEIKQKYQAQIAEEKKKYEGEQEKLKQEKLNFEQAKKKENEFEWNTNVKKCCNGKKNWLKYGPTPKKNEFVLNRNKKREKCWHNKKEKKKVYLDSVSWNL